MRYIVTGKYANGDDYAEATESLTELEYIISKIDTFHNLSSIKEDQRVDATTVKIETEEGEHAAN